MSKAPQASQLIKIFMASPSDVREERETLASLVLEINEVLAFLAPNQSMRLELMRYETHTYPDYGEAQEVINRQIPQDYDVFVGVMWKRCGTPTASAQSGTIEEFSRALARREQSGRPTIMFYFCDEPFAPPRGEEFDQYSRVIKFREELESKGYTLSYPDRKAFRDYVRSGLLRAIADIARLNEGVETPQSVQQRDIAEELEIDAEMAALSGQYDQIRVSMPSGNSRTRKMSELQAAMRTKAAGARPSLRLLKNSNSAGQRLAAISILQQFPSFSEIDWLADRLNPESEAPFVGYAAAVALAQVVRSLSIEDNATAKTTKLKECLERALALAERNPNDPPRLRVLHTAIQELASKAIQKRTNKLV